MAKMPAATPRSVSNQQVFFLSFLLACRNIPSAVNMSAMTPPQLVRGEEPNAPAKKRRVMSVSIF